MYPILKSSYLHQCSQKNNTEDSKYLGHAHAMEFVKYHIKSLKTKTIGLEIVQTKTILMVPSVRSFSIIVYTTAIVAIAMMTTTMLPSHWESYAGQRTVRPFGLDVFQHFCQILDVGRRIRAGSLSINKTKRLRNN